MSQEQDKAFFRNFSLIVGTLAVMMVIFIFAARFVGFDDEAGKKREEAAAAKLTAPVGEVSVAAPAQEAAPAQAAVEVAVTVTAPGPVSDKGKQIYDGLCTSCHGSGIPGIPQMGDKAAWEPRIAQGKDTLYRQPQTQLLGLQKSMCRLTLCCL